MLVFKLILKLYFSYTNQLLEENRIYNGSLRVITKPSMTYITFEPVPSTFMYVSIV